MTRSPPVERVGDTAQLVDCAVYVDGKRLPGDWTPATAMAEVRARRDGFVWCGLYEPDDEQLHQATEVFGLPGNGAAHVVRTHHRPKLTRYDNLLCLIMKTVRYLEHDSPTTANEIVDTGEIVAFLGADFVLTVRHAEHSGLRDLRAELEAAPERLLLGPAVVLHGIADRVVDHYLMVSEEFENDIDAIESGVFEPRSRIGAEQLYLLKREIVELNRAIVPLAAPLRRLVSSEDVLVPSAVRSYFRDVEDHLTTVAERVANNDELLTSLVTATLAKLSLQQNADMRKITAWAAIIAVPTMIVGVYGMNFDVMPELHWRFGYPLVVAVMVGSCAVLYVIFRRNRWL
ncbi:magnesium and cobalt transport protein CorA [Actinophytocola sediminis]